MSDSWKNITWQDVLSDISIDGLEHPVHHSTFIQKEEYYNEFRILLDLLHGKTISDFLDLYFVRDIVNVNFLTFIDGEARKDFFEVAVDLGCIEPLKVICTGETLLEKTNRAKQEMNKHSRKIQKEKKKYVSEQEKKLKKLYGIMKSFDTIKSSKLEKTKKYFEKEYENYKKLYGLVEAFEESVKLF